MKCNQNTIIESPSLFLVPYRPEHVPKYHEWMQSPAMQAATASEPLSLQEEYDMQRSWREDEDKLTFIVLHRPSPESLRSDCPLIGDVNIFISHDEDSSDEEAKIAELEVMIASPEHLRKGYGRMALLLMLNYAQTQLNLSHGQFIAKIGLDNMASRGLFTRLGFSAHKISEVFGEVEMRVQTVENAEKDNVIPDWTIQMSIYEESLDDNSV